MKDGGIVAVYLLLGVLYWYRGIAGRRLRRKRWQFNGVLFAFGCAILVSCNSRPEGRHGKDGSLMAGYLPLSVLYWYHGILDQEEASAGLSCGGFLSARKEAVCYAI